MDEPKDEHSPPLNILLGAYNQTYLICKREVVESKGEEEDDSYQERRVLFRCGNWCYTGNITLDKEYVCLNDLPKAIPMLQRQQNRLHFYCNASGVPSESQFFGPLKFVNEATEFAANELGSEHVQDELAKWSEAHEWLKDEVSRTYFELQADAPACMSELALAASKTYSRGLVIITVYFESVFYVVVQDGEGDQPLLDVKFPDVSQPGRGIQLCSYNELGGRWRALTLWHSAATSTPSRAYSQPAPQKTLSLSSDSYVQMYTILKAVSEPGCATNPYHEVLFRFGSWCYSGSVQLTPQLELTDLPHIIPALRMQQSRLDFVCDVTRIPVTSPFSKPMSYMAKLEQRLECQLAHAEQALRDLVNRLSVNNVDDSSVAAWLDASDPSRSFFEFQLALPNDVATRQLKNVELIASKTYLPSGVLLISVLFDSTLYAILCDMAGEQPLLDSRFPNVSSKGRGYLLASHPYGIDGWPELRKVTIWQTKQDLDFQPVCRSPVHHKSTDGDDEDDHSSETEGTECENPLSARTSAVVAQSKADGPIMNDRYKSSKPDDHQRKARDDRTDASKQVEATNSIQSAPTAEPKTTPHPLLSEHRLHGSTGRVNAPHRVPAVASLNEKLQKVREQLSSSGTEAPWDDFGRPRNISFKK